MSWLSKRKEEILPPEITGEEGHGRDIERGLVARYLARIFERSDLPLRAMCTLLYWVNERRESMDLPVPSDVSEVVSDLYSGRFRFADLDKVYRRNRDKLIRNLRQVAEETPRPEPIASNVDMLVKALGLPKESWKIIGLVACYTRYNQVEYLSDTITDHGPLSRGIALMVGEPARSIEHLVSPLGDLASSGILQLRESYDNIAGGGGRFAIPWRIDACLDHQYDDFASLRQAMLGDPAEPHLNISDYDHVAKDRDFVVDLLQGAAKEQAVGINILLYGPPGSGKTELAKLAAAAADTTIYGAGEEVSIGGESDRSERLADLVFALRLLAGAEKTTLLFDEMEDVAWQLMRRGGSKLYLNRLLESNPIPIVWTSNNINEIDPAVLRRMTLAVELKLPPARQRERILERLDRRVGVGLTPDEVSQLANRIDATPAVLENALKAARLAGSGSAAVERAAQGIVRAVSGSISRRTSAIPDFDPALTCADLDLSTLATQLASTGQLGFSLCLSGPPGTGKSAYARYLAHSLGLEVLHKRASDLLGAFVGESEKRIAEAFEEAREASGFLVFDEAETFLFDRRDASRSWEISQVNEMLTWMEDHPLPFCCTTNLMDRFDSASLRRFTFHIRFAFLDQAALKRAYAVFFQMADVPSAGLAPANLTPGDFAQARRQARVLGVMDDTDRIVELLATISRTKPGAAGAIGFMK